MARNRTQNANHAECPRVMIPFDQFDITNWLLHILTRVGVKDVVISPGSRNAPVMIALRKNFPEVRLHSVVDERSAGFKAIGIADITKMPVVIVCTSGTASANYLPAICEAFFRSVPLIAITADRPERLISARDGQTIYQHHLFGRHVEAFWSLSPAMSENQLKSALSDIHGTLLKIQRPVHINVHYDEPLYLHRSFSGLPFELAYTEDPPIAEKLPEISTFKNVMIVAGQCAPGSIPEELQQALRDKGLLLVSGGLSNLNPTLSVTHFNQINTTVLPEPELVITIGGEITHKPLKNYLRSIKNLVHWHIEQIDYEPDTFGKNVRLFRMPGITGLREIASGTATLNGNFASQWIMHDAEAEAISVQRLDEECQHFYLPLAKAAIGLNALIVLGNSTVVRQYLKLPRVFHLNLYGNRGTAGIDGSLSTAVGMAIATSKKVWCLLGDLSFLYDINALWHHPIPENLTIFVFNNHRGKIFEMIPGPEKFPEIYPFQATPHSYNFRHIANHFSMNYHLWNQKYSFNFSDNLQKSIIEIST